MGRGFMGGAHEAGFGFGLMQPPVTNAPYAATFTSTETEKLQDGTVLTRNVTRVATRDSLGRTREEVTMPARKGGDGKPHTTIVIVDPVAHTVTRLQADEKLAIVHQIPAPRPHDGPGGMGRRGPGGPPPQDASAPPPPDGGQGPRGRHGDKNAVVADLGTKTINGVLATGKRVTRTIPVDGTDKPVVATHEEWFSPDLKIQLSRNDVDPFRGTHTTIATALTKAEPDAALFKVPQGYTVEQAAQHMGRRGPMGPPSGM